MVFAQVRWRMEVETGAHCKTVGSAYVGSNPAPATTSETASDLWLRGRGCPRRRQAHAARCRREPPHAATRGIFVGWISPGLAAEAIRI
jgi:hypothetical protein